MTGGHIGGPLLVWLLKKDEMPFLNDQGKESLNFQITLLIGYLAISVLSTVLALLTFGLLGGLGSLTWVLWLIGSIFSVLGFLSAREGRPYRYPFALRLIS